MYELVICAALVGGNCDWQITPQPSLQACENIGKEIVCPEECAADIRALLK
jgi:hypothetical protein